MSRRSMITNRRVFNALTSGITKRWNLYAASDIGFAPNAAPCKLCDLFDRMDRPYNGCAGCPLKMAQGGVTCHSRSSLYCLWYDENRPLNRKALAKEMLELLTKIRQEHFGDWPEMKEK